MSKIPDPDTLLLLTLLPWHARQDADGEWLKVPSLPAGFHYEDFEYGQPAVPLCQWGWRGWNRWGQRIPQDDQPGYVTSYRSGVIVVDHDSADFAAWLESIGVRLPPTTEVSTGRPGGRHQIFDGRHLARDQWPRQRNYLGLGDIRSHGFCAAPTAVHPSGRRYELVRPMQPALWDPEWTRLLDEAWAAMNRGTGDSYERTEGSGRNCELISLKGSLFAQGYDEDHPELVRMILERNAGFSVPLSEDEVAATILRYKGWTRQVPGVMQDAGEERLGDAELQEYKTRMVEAFGRTEGTQDGSAGQDPVYGLKEGDLHSRKQPADLLECEKLWSPCVPLTAPADLKAKWAAERDDHELSRDWDHRGGEQSRTAYGWVMQQLIAGIEVHREQIEDQIWKCLSRESPNGAILLSEGEDGQVIAWSDPETDPPDEDWEDRDPWPSYPGCPEGRNPKAGPYIGRELGEQAVKAAWAAQGGVRATGRVLTEWINTHRAELGMESPGDPLGCRYMHLANVRRITRELYDRGELKKAQDEEHYRKMHTWRTLPAAYVPVANPVPTLAYQMRQAFGEEPRSSRRTARRHRHQISGGLTLSKVRD